METTSISRIIACHVCPVRYVLERDREASESPRYTVAKQIASHLGGELDAARIWKEVGLVNPSIDPAMEAECGAWVEACRAGKFRRATESDVRVVSKRLGIHGTVDRLFDEEPLFSIVRSSEAPAAGLYTSDRIRIACYTICIEESFGTRPKSGIVEHIPSGIARICEPQPRDRRAALRAIETAKRIDRGDLPRKPRNAPCETCHLADICAGTGRRLADLL
jgi:CRISPR-associated exonuclease Cas4